MSADTFLCKRCKQELDIAFEVVTRFRTHTCSVCWGKRTSLGKMHVKPPDPEFCGMCRVRPARMALDGRRIWCTECTNEYMRKRRRRRSESSSENTSDGFVNVKQVVPRETCGAQTMASPNTVSKPPPLRRFDRQPRRIDALNRRKELLDWHEHDRQTPLTGCELLPDSERTAIDFRVRAAKSQNAGAR